MCVNIYVYVSTYVSACVYKFFFSDGLTETQQALLCNMRT